jgi:hypothetical protein
MTTSKVTSTKAVILNDLPVEEPKKAAFNLIFSIKNFLAGGQLARLVESIRQFFHGKNEGQKTVLTNVPDGTSNINQALPAGGKEINLMSAIRVPDTELAHIPVLRVQMEPVELFDDKPPSKTATQSDPTEKSTEPVSAWMDIVNRSIPEPDYSANTLDAYIKAQQARTSAIDTNAQNGDPNNGIVSEPKGQMAQALAKRVARNAADKLS